MTEAGKSTRGESDDEGDDDASDQSDDEEGPERGSTATTFRVDDFTQGNANLLTDGYIYVGAQAHKEMDTATFMITDRLQKSYITTAMSTRYL